MNYTDERNVQILIALLKAHGINKVVVSPGTTNMTFVVSIQNDPWFKIWSCVDERSAAYMACGMASECGEPVVISCTGATASRNYMPALTESFYRKIPVLAVTSTRGNHRIGHLIDQQIDRRNIPNDIAVESITLPMVKDKEDERYCEIEANKAILALKLNGGGPVHVNMYTRYSKNFSVKEIPAVNVIRRYTLADDSFPQLPTSGRIAVYVGAHQPFTEKEKRAIECFCSINNAVVFCDHTSGYRGRYGINAQIIYGQRQWRSSLRSVDLCIHIGEVSGSQGNVNIKKTWRVNPDGALRDTFGNLENVFMMPEIKFFEIYSKGETNHSTEYIDALKAEQSSIMSMIPELPFSNIWMAQKMSKVIPSNSVLHLGIYHSLRSWNFFELPMGVEVRSNVGGFGIDGGVSTMIGASLCNKEKIYIGVFGDLAFFYDMNVLGNRHVGNNVRILLVNNGRGNEFRNYGHPCHFLGEEADENIAAAGHFGNKSECLVRHYAESLGFDYLSASSKEDFENVYLRFLGSEQVEKPILLEVFTNTEDESLALELILNFVVDNKLKIKNDVSNAVKRFIGQKGVEVIKKLIR